MTSKPVHLADHIDVCKALIGCHRPSLIVDFDGTLSELKPNPSDAIIDPVCLTLLEELDTFLGAFAGLLEALAGIVKDENPEQYRMMVLALEKVALK